MQERLLAAYQGQFPEVLVRRGLELSVDDAHTNSFGGTPHLPDYRRGPAASHVGGDAEAYARWSAALIHGWGGLASINHVFGSHAQQQSAAQQTAHRRQIASRLLAACAYGMDLLEVGYRVRGGATLEQHLALWDTLSCAGTWLTGNGVNDAHGGREVSWRALTNRFSTTVLAGSTSEADLLAALRAGRAYVGELGSFAGLLQVDAGGCPMGSVSVQPGVAQRPLTVTATSVPAGAVVQVVQSPVDFGADLDPKSQVVATLPARAFTAGTATVVLDTGRSCFARAQVVSAAGQVVAFTNPVWLLQSPPPVPVPPARRAPDSRD